MSDKPTPFVWNDGRETKRHAPATERNRDAITDVLRAHLPEAGLVLEIASGTGEHAVHFARAFPKLTWQPTDMEEAALASIAAHSAEAALSNVAPPLRLDVEQAWPIKEAQAILCINMVHISPWSATLALFENAAEILGQGGLLYLYGPFFEGEKDMAPSNLAFDQSLKERNPEWGIRNVKDVADIAASFDMRLADKIVMPANNLSLIFRRS